MIKAIHGLYAVTPDMDDTAALAAKVAQAITGGARFIQYRNKAASAKLRKQQAQMLAKLCIERAAALIVNDHVELAREVAAAGVHIGAEDGTLAEARAVLGPGKLIGVSCYDKLELARAAQSGGATYVAFGSFFPSQVKPGAVRATLPLLEEARRALTVPIVAIGGITPENAPQLVAAGADAVAVITAVFGEPDVTTAASRFTQLFGRP